MSGNLGFKISEANHSGADTTLAPTNVSAPPTPASNLCPGCFSLLCRPLLVRAQGTDPEPLPHCCSQACRLEAQRGECGPLPGRAR